MNLDELNKVAQRHGRARQGHPGRRRILRHHQEALRRHRRANHRGQPPRLSRDAVPLGRGHEEHISGVILYDETICQKAKDGTPLVELIKKAGALPGIKVDEGTKPLPICPGEVVTDGLDGLADRLPKYHEQGARFAKWRAVIDIGAGIPSYNCINANAHALARYAALCQAGADRADRRAGSADGRRPRHRRAASDVTEMGAEGTCSRSCSISRRRARRHGAQAQHGRSPARSAPSALASRKSPRRP